MPYKQISIIFAMYFFVSSFQTNFVSNKLCFCGSLCSKRPDQVALQSSLAQKQISVIFAMYFLSLFHIVILSRGFPVPVFAGIPEKLSCPFSRGNQPGIPGIVFLFLNSQSFQYLIIILLIILTSNNIIFFKSLIG